MRSVKAGVHQFPCYLGAFFPIGSTGNLPARMPIQPQPDSFVEQTKQIIHVGVVVAVTDVYPVEIYALFLQDGNLLVAHPVGRPGVGGNGDSGGLFGSWRRLSTPLPGVV